MKDIRVRRLFSKMCCQVVILGQTHVAYLQRSDIKLRSIMPRGLDPEYVLRLHVTMSVAPEVYLLQCTGQSTELVHDVFDQGSGKTRVVTVPELPQVPPVCPLEHEIAFIVSGDRCHEPNNVRVIALGNLFVCFDFLLPLFLKVTHRPLVFGVGAMQFLDGNTGVLTINNTHVSEPYEMEFGKC